MTYKKLINGQVRYWALIVSVAAHSATLAVFTGVKLSGRISEEPTARPAINLHMIQQVVSEPTLKPKPRIEPIAPPQVPTETRQPPLIAKPELPPPVETDALPESRESEPVEPVVTAPVHEVEFFGRKSAVQRVCYVVDCSGSMYGSMYLVKEQLKQSILNLNSQQAFSVVFFMEGQNIVTSGIGNLEPATVRAKSKAVKLIESVRPAGSTDAEHALQQAMKLKDTEGHGPEVIYFLSDGFDLDPDRSARFVRRVDQLRRSFAQHAILHTIGFWPLPQDCRTLRSLAENAGGDFIEIN
jgi:hypothetical protein